MLEVTLPWVSMKFYIQISELAALCNREYYFIEASNTRHHTEWSRRNQNVIYTTILNEQVLMEHSDTQFKTNTSWDSASLACF